MDIIDYVFLGIGTALAIVYLVVNAAVTGKYKPLIENLSDDEHFLKSVYPIGFFVLDAIGFEGKGSFSLKRKQQCELIHGHIYADYYFRLNCAQKAASMLLLLPLGFLLYPMLDSGLSLVMGLAAMAVAFWNYDMKITDEMSKREDEIARDLPDIYSKLTLLVNAGMVLREAWERTSITGDSSLYMEMRNSVMEMQNGTPEGQAILNFGMRCNNPEAKKFASTLVQNITKGNRELVDFLLKQSSAGWEEKKQYVRQKGERASTQMTLPTAGMMIGIMIMIIVPMFGNMRF